MIGDLSIIDIDPKSPMYGIRQVVKSRIVIFKQNKRKSREVIINILKKFDVILNFSYLTDITLVNILTDCCYSNVASKLLGDKIQ